MPYMSAPVIGKLYAKEIMSNSALKWILLLTYIAAAVVVGNALSCPSDQARPLVILLSSTVIVYINVCFFLKLPINLLHIPEAANVSNFSLRRRLVLVSWLMVLALIIWGLADGFSCSV